MLSEYNTDVVINVFQMNDVRQRLKSLQDDYSALQNAHDRLESGAVTRESDLQSEVVRLKEKEQEEKSQRNEQEKTVKKLQARITELEQALREGATPPQVKSFEVYICMYVSIHYT